MKTLSRFVVKVANQKQLDIALKFFARASRRPLNVGSITSMHGMPSVYVGMYGRTVNVGPVKFPYETSVPFTQMDSLADTNTRKAALKASGWWEAVKTERPRQPLMQFDYPNRETLARTRRSVRLIKADSRYFIGLEILPDNRFQFKKFLKAKARNVEVLEF
jgi:hypothetical protein